MQSDVARLHLRKAGASIRQVGPFHRAIKWCERVCVCTNLNAPCRADPPMALNFPIDSSILGTHMSNSEYDLPRIRSILTSWKRCSCDADPNHPKGMIRVCSQTNHIPSHAVEALQPRRGSPITWKRDDGLTDVAKNTEQRGRQVQG